MHVVEEPPKSGLAIKRQVSGSEYLEMGKTKQIQSLSEQSNNSHLNIQDQINHKFSIWNCC